MTEQQQFPVKWNAGLQPGPDGRTWCTISIELPFGTFGTMAPPELIEELGRKLPNMFFDIAKQARKQDGSSVSDLTIAPASVLNELRKGTNNDKS